MKPQKTEDRRVDVHEQIAHLIWKWRDSKLSCDEIADLLLITMHENSLLAADLIPDGLPANRSWPHK